MNAHAACTWNSKSSIPQEEEEGNVKILNTVREPNRDIDYRAVTSAAKCSKHSKSAITAPLENWKVNVPDAWTFDYYIDFPSPDKAHRVIYHGYLCEVAMGGPSRGEGFLETADKRLKSHRLRGLWAGTWCYEANGFRALSQELLDAQLEGGTGGEIFSIVLDKLIQIKKQRPEVYAVIREETDWMIAYARKIDYL